MARKKGAGGKPLPAVMLDLIVGYWVSQLVHVVARLGLADLMKGGPKSPAELARSVGADPQTLHRVLRALASVGVSRPGRTCCRASRPDSPPSTASTA